MGRHATLINDPLPPPNGGHRARRYHYVAVTVESDPEVVAEQCNRKAGEGYMLVAQIPVPRTGRTEVLLTFCRRLRRSRVRPVAPAEAPGAIPAAPPENPEGDLTPREEAP